MDEEYEEIELLGDEFHHALLGAVYESDGTPVPCYSSGAIVDSLMHEGYTEEMAVDYINEVTADSKILWVHPLELEPEFTPDNKPHLRLVH
jgi:hypothetical protein|tara:strand:- start:226 stop:498 length:273 start_codon:yes stop_codon:yes gene_type:complete